MTDSVSSGTLSIYSLPYAPNIAALTDTSVISAGHPLVPGMTGTDKRSVQVCTVGVVAAVSSYVLTLVDIFVTVRSSPARIQFDTRRAAGHIVTRLTTTQILTVPSPALFRTYYHTTTTMTYKLNIINIYLVFFL